MNFFSRKIRNIFEKSPQTKHKIFELKKKNKRQRIMEYGGVNKLQMQKSATFYS